MEGEKFKGRVMSEFNVVRQLFWIDPEVPPELVYYPEKLYVITNVDSNAFQSALEGNCCRHVDVTKFEWT